MSKVFINLKVWIILKHLVFVVKQTTIHIILTLTLSYNWHINQKDINDAFLYIDLQENVFMLQPPSFEYANSNRVSKLHKAIYGLKQAPRSWFQKLSTVLSSFEFSSTKSDSSLFIKCQNYVTLFVLIYVDDIIITGSSYAAIKSLIHLFQNHFGLKDLGKLNYFLGVETSWTADGSLHLSQNKYIKDLLHKSSMTLSKSQPTPMVSSTRLSQDGTTTFENALLYRFVIRSLQYLLITRPKLYSVNKVCQFMHHPQQHHFESCKANSSLPLGSQTHNLLLR